jgi:adenylate cyclase
MRALDALNAARAGAGKPVAAVDLALHLGEVGRKVLVSAALAAASEGCGARLEPLGHHVLRGVREAREIFALAL